MPNLTVTSIRSYTTYPIWFLRYYIHVRDKLSFRSIMKHLCIVCAIECVMATFMKLEILKLRRYGRRYKKYCHMKPNFSWYNSLIT